MKHYVNERYEVGHINDKLYSLNERLTSNVAGYFVQFHTDEWFFELRARYITEETATLVAQNLIVFNAPPEDTQFALAVGPNVSNKMPKHPIRKKKAK
jgi:hypothetical protein